MRAARRRSRRLLAALALPLALGAVGGALARPLDAQSGDARRVAIPNRGDLSLGDAPRRVSVGGEELPVLGLAPVGEWTLAIAVDAELSRRAGVEAAAETLAEAAERLTALGDVRLLVVDGLVEERLPPTRDAATLRSALGELPGLEPSDAGAGRGGDPDLVRWQREALVDWLLEAAPEGPKALFLLQDAWDPGVLGTAAPAVAASPSRGAATQDRQLPDPVLDDDALAVALAAAGWVAHPLDLAGAAREDDATDDVQDEPGHAALAIATGGRVVRSTRDLDAALDALAGAVSVAFERPPTPTGPLAFHLAPRAPTLSPPTFIGGAFLPGRAAARARRFLAEGDPGELAVEATLGYEGPNEESVAIEVRADFPPGAAPTDSSWLSVSLHLGRLDAPPLEIEIRGGGRPLGGIDRWVAQIALRMPRDPGELVAVVSDGATGAWGAGRIEEEGAHLSRPGPGLAVETFDLRPPAEPREEGEAPRVITLVAPRGADLRGRQRFRTLVTVPVVARAVFYLDGEVVAEDDDAPFDARIDLGRAVARHTVAVEGYDVVGNLVGADSIRLNEPARPFDVTLSEVSIDATGRLAASAEVSHPTDVGVERLDFYYNERLLETRRAAPWSLETRVGPVEQTDYVRVVAHFADGGSLEDVRLVAALGTTEEVEVNLVQVYAVVTDPQGRPVTDLEAEDFELRLGGRPQPIERFAFADEVPLELALVIDTSGSMWALIPDTKRAAARFLTQVLTERDRALVVDFADRPRVAMPLTGDIGRLLNSLGTMEAERDAMTALYDSVVFSALELPSGQSRKAVVLLTDGDDTRSRFSLGRAIDTAREAGLPVYVVSLVGIHDPRRAGRRTDIDALTHQTGGDAYYLSQMQELGETYERIARELRSQYLLAFPTDTQLSERDIESIRVVVDRPGVEIRTVVGGRSVD